MALTNGHTVNQERFMENPPRVSEFRRVVRIFFGRKLAVVGFVFVIALIAVAIFAPLLAPMTPDPGYKPYSATPSNNLWALMSSVIFAA
jgi:ABC-type antimicrobial peptide transport system permease subunit